MQEKLKNVWRIESTLIITFQVTEENEADQTALEENYPSIGDPKEIGQTHNMFFPEFSGYESTNFFYQILCNICFDFLKCSKLRKKKAFFDQ